MKFSPQVIQWCFKNFGDTSAPLFLSRWLVDHSPNTGECHARHGSAKAALRVTFFLGESDSGEHPNDLLCPWFLLVEYQWLSPLRLVKLQGPSWNEESRRFFVFFFCYGLKMIYSLQNTCRASKISGLKARFCGLGGEDWPRFFSGLKLLWFWTRKTHSHPLQPWLRWRNRLGLKGFTWTWQPTHGLVQEKSGTGLRTATQNFSAYINWMFNFS